MWNLVKTVLAVSEKKTFNDFTNLYMYIARGQGQIAPKILTVAKQFYFFNHRLYVSTIIIHWENDFFNIFPIHVYGSANLTLP